MGSGFHVVTGAFGYSGKYITSRLLARGQKVRTLTNSTGRENPFGGRIEVKPYHFDQPDMLMESLLGGEVLYNTYWVRFNKAGFKHAEAVRNTRILFEAAMRAGVRKVVHISITNPSEDSPLEYFSGKARLERALIDSGLEFSILRPTVLFGKEDILINNIAWLLRRLPVFGVFGDGQYKLQPIYVDDLSELAVEQGRAHENQIIDAIGPETFTYLDLVKMIGSAIGRIRPIISIPPRIGYAAGWILGKLVHDVLITREEIKGLMEGLLTTNSPPAGKTRLSSWAHENGGSLGLHYASELARRQNRVRSYENL